jgi:hypothetical protein
LIAAQAEVSGLRQIYTSNNVRVRSAEARVNELQSKLNEIGGSDSLGAVKESGMIFPSIRKLPILGVTYADLYLQTKIQQTVFELLTQQYEMAKVQEAKEIPSVKVLDVAVVPTKRSFPPRLLITILGTLLGLAAAVTWIIARTKWDAADAGNPRKVLATEVFMTVRARLPQFTRNGHSAVSNRSSRGSSSKKSGNENEELGDEDDAAK